MDIEAIIKKYIGEDGNIPGSTVGDIVKGIKSAVGNEFVEKDRYKSKLTEIDELKGRLQDAEDSVTTAEKWKTKFEESEKAFSDYKSEQTLAATRTKKERAYRALLKEVGISDKFKDRAMKGVSLDQYELDENGKFVDAEKLTNSIKKEWGDCIVTEETVGATTPNPQGRSNEQAKGPSRAAEVYAKYHNDLFGKKED